MISILLDENMHIKLTDFGTAKLLDDEDPTPSQYNTNEIGEEGKYDRHL
jgi:serine/threonine protein kinase